MKNSNILHLQLTELKFWLQCLIHLLETLLNQVIPIDTIVYQKIILKYLIKAFLNTKPFENKTLDDSVEMDISHEFVNIPKNRNLQISIIPEETITKAPKPSTDNLSFWAQKKKYESLSKTDLSCNTYC